jgi:CubicO group peptidase (beta-lactamase class C family)
MYDAAGTLAQFADSVARLPLLFTPGTRWSYSSSLEIVGRIIEVISGQPLDEFMDREIFEPLGMDDTSFRLNDDVDEDDVVVLYERGEDGRLAIVQGGLLAMYEPAARFLWASGGLLSTPDDFLRFAQMLLNGGELNGVRVLSAQRVREMTSAQVPEHLLPHPRTTLVNDGYGFGLAGSVLVDQSKADLPGTTGIYRWNGYVGTYFWIDPRNQLIGMVWTQHNPGRQYPLEAVFQRLVYEALVP